MAPGSLGLRLRFNASHLPQKISNIPLYLWLYRVYQNQDRRPCVWPGSPASPPNLQSKRRAAGVMSLQGVGQ